MNAMMEAMQVLSEIESMSKRNRDPESIKLDPITSGPGLVKMRGVHGKFKLHTGKNLAPKHLMKNLKTLHDLHRAAADEYRFKAHNAKKDSKQQQAHLDRAEFHDKKADAHAAKLQKMAA